MENASSRLMAAVGLLALVSIGFYWIYEPSGPDADRLAPLPGVTPLPAARSGPERVAGPVQPPVEPLPVPKPAEPVKPTPDPKAAANPQPVKGVIPPSFTDYTIKAGETFESIAKAKYGSARHHTAIAAANPLKDPRRVRAGDVIRLPVDPTNIQGKPVEITPPTPHTPATPHNPSNPDATPRTGPDAGPFSEYVVQPGDTLSGIAREVWGSSKNWRKILDANKGTLPSEEKLRPGMKLRIPPKPAD